MSRARNLADLLDASGDVVSGALDNVPPSNDASALTTGTLAAARLPASGVDASSLTTGTLPVGRLPSSGVDAGSLTTGTLPIARVADNGITDSKIAALSASKLSGRVPVSNAPSGSVVQVQSYTYTSTWSTTGTDTATPLSVSITPSSASNKVLIFAVIQYDETRGNAGGGWRITRNGSVIGNAPSAGNRYTVHAGFNANANADQSLMNSQVLFLDSPSTTSSITYNIRVYRGNAGSFSTFINRARADSDDGDDPRAVSTITVMEIAV
jgi:hypothetical protein